jgi:hypothetical protein
MIEILKNEPPFLVTFDLIVEMYAHHNHSFFCELDLDQEGDEAHFQVEIRDSSRVLISP